MKRWRRLLTFAVLFAVLLLMLLVHSQSVPKRMNILQWRQNETHRCINQWG